MDQVDRATGATPRPGRSSSWYRIGVRKNQGRSSARDDELDVPEDGVERRDGERQPGDEEDDHDGDRDREPRGVAALRPEPEREHEDDRRHRRERHELRRDDGQRDELAREANLADQRRVLDDAARAAVCSDEARNAQGGSPQSRKSQ